MLARNKPKNSKMDTAHDISVDNDPRSARPHVSHTFICYFFRFVRQAFNDFHLKLKTICCGYCCIPMPKSNQIFINVDDFQLASWLHLLCFYFLSKKKLKKNKIYWKSNCKAVAHESIIFACGQFIYMIASSR